MTTLQIPDELAQEFEQIAADKGRDKQEFMLEALANYLEDREDSRLIEERLAHPGRRLSLEEVERNLGLDD